MPFKSKKCCGIPSGEVLVFPDGRTITYVEQGNDDNGKYLILEHEVNQKGAMNGPHWHPILKETFTVKEGRMRFLLDGKE